jgi:hypothetical protein
MHIAGNRKPLGLAGGGDDFAGIRRAAGERLFTDDVLAGFQCGHCHRHMQRGGHTEIDKIDLRVSEQVGEVAINAQLASEVERIRAMDVAAHTGEDAVDRHSHGIAHRHDPGLFDFLIGLEMGDAHEAEPDDRDVDLAFGCCGFCHDVGGCGLKSNERSDHLPCC